MIRSGRFGDIPRLTELFREMHARSKYATRATLDEKHVKSLIVQALQRHGATHDGGTWVKVAEVNDVVEGFIIGVLDRVYHIGVELMATDLFFYCSPRSDVKAAGELLDSLVGWAKENPKVVEVCCAMTDAIGDWERTMLLYRRHGFKTTGGMAEISFERTR